MYATHIATTNHEFAILEPPKKEPEEPVSKNGKESLNLCHIYLLVAFQFRLFSATLNIMHTNMLKTEDSGSFNVLLDHSSTSSPKKKCPGGAREGGVLGS